MSSRCGIHKRKTSLRCAAASASMPRSAPQSKTQGSGICSVCDRNCATASVSSHSGLVQPTWPSMRPRGWTLFADGLGDALGHREPLGGRPPELLRVLEGQALELGQLTRLRGA
ncbi:MAG: hypothetical protein V9G29_04230 [Burkholderiaceae bacterium]